MTEYVPETESQFIDRVYAAMKVRRRELRLTQDLSAKRLNKSQFWWSARERGEQKLTLPDALVIAAALEIPVLGHLPVPKPPRVKRQPAPPAKPVEKPVEKPRRPLWETAGPLKPTPAQMPKKAEPASVRVAGVAKVPVQASPKLPSTFMWKDDLKVNAGANSVTLGILAVDGDLEAVLELPVSDARRMKDLLALKLPHRHTEASGYVTNLLDRMNRAMTQAVTQNRRAKVMRLMQPEVMAVMTDVWSEMRAVKDGAKAQEEELLSQKARLQEELQRLKKQLEGRVDPEDQAADTIRQRSAESERVTRLTRDVERLESEKRVLNGKLERLRQEMEQQDKRVEQLQKQLKEKEEAPSDGKVNDLEKSMDQALTILDEIWDLAALLAESSSADNKMTGRTLQSKMKEMGYDSE